jgi:naphthoate synthase
MWFRNIKLTAKEALDLGLVNKVVPDDALRAETMKMAAEIAKRGPFALAAIKGAFNARHGGVAGMARVSHDLLLKPYLDSEESQELAASFAEKRSPDESKFGK